MKSKISKFKIEEDKKGFVWCFEEECHRFESKNPIVAFPLKSEERILVVEPASNEAPNNAIIINGKGDVILRIANPEERNGAICFCDAYCNGEELILIIAFRSFQKRCHISENGELLGVFDSR